MDAHPVDQDGGIGGCVVRAQRDFDKLPEGVVAGQVGDLHTHAKRCERQRGPTQQ